jgi:mannose-1-phosphate guanylyltransferase
MKAVIFAGGVGTRLWPLSRKSSPKQFEKVIGNQSTLQQAAGRLLPDISWKDIYVSTGDKYTSLVRKQLPDIPPQQIIGEPQMRDVGPAVGLMTAILFKENPREPIAILWSDHLVKNQQLFRKILMTASGILKKDPDKIVFIGQSPRFANQNLGWIEYQKTKFIKDNIKFLEYKSLKYRPSLEQAKEFVKKGHYAWNLGYFVTTPAFIWQQYKTYAPDMYKFLLKIADAWGSSDFTKILKEVYPLIEKISFDDAILEKIDPGKALVVTSDIGWSDIGAWEALKEALQTNPKQNIIQGKVLVTDCQDNLIYNTTPNLVAAIDIKGLLVINTPDVVLVCHKDSVPKIKKLVESLNGTANEHLT